MEPLIFSANSMTSLKAVANVTTARVIDTGSGIVALRQAVTVGSKVDQQPGVNRENSPVLFWLPSMKHMEAIQD